MHHEETEQLLPRVSARADDGDPDLWRLHERCSMTQNRIESKKFTHPLNFFLKDKALAEMENSFTVPLSGHSTGESDGT
jgi:hypothetical protein